MEDEEDWDEEGNESEDEDVPWGDDGGWGAALAEASRAQQTSLRSAISDAFQLLEQSGGDPYALADLGGLNSIDGDALSMQELGTAVHLFTSESPEAFEAALQKHPPAMALLTDLSSSDDGRSDSGDNASLADMFGRN